jgi:hypothetical protein
MLKISKHFRSSVATTVVGLIIAFGIGLFEGGSQAAAFKALIICAVLGVLEISLSFDNAVVNATVLKDMTPLWQHRFLTWGMLIAVFGVRLVLPLAIVSIMASIGPWDALMMAATAPDQYAELMQKLHVPVAAFGGTFLILVALRYFLDPEKESHWVPHVEKPLVHLGKLRAIEIVTVAGGLYAVSLALPPDSRFLSAGIAGLVLFVVIDWIGSILEGSGDTQTSKSLERASIGSFLYLEVLDASFSFDGVVGAFAITHNLFIITIGLGIGAMFVRSITIALVEKGTLAEFIYLEHGAFYAIGALGTIMISGAFFHIPELITALLGVALIGLALLSSVRHNRERGA